MSRCKRYFVTSGLALALAAASAWAEEPASEREAESSQESQEGKFDAGAKMRFPSGPDEQGQFGMFKWMAVDLRGQYGVTEKGVVSFKVPLAVLKPDTGSGPNELQTFGGFTAKGALGLGDMLGVNATLGMMRQGAFLLSDADYPAFVGDLKFGGIIGPMLNLKTGVLDVATSADLTFQLESAGQKRDETLLALALPVSALVQVGEIIKVGVQTGVYTGEGFSLSASEGGRLPVLAAVSLKLGSLYLDTSLGFASLLTSKESGSAYPGITDSFTAGLNARWAN